MLAHWLERAPSVDPSWQLSTKFAFPAPKVAQVSWDPETTAITPDTQLPSWVFTTKLVAKPDQLIKRRGKAGLLALNKTWDEAKEWIRARAGKPQKVSCGSPSPSSPPPHFGAIGWRFPPSGRSRYPGEPPVVGFCLRAVLRNERNPVS